MYDLAERIKGSLENPNRDLWFPELTTDLSARAWDCLHSDIGLAADSYGTERVLSRSISAPRKIITYLKTSPSSGASTIAIEVLTQECAVKYQEKGVSFYLPDEILNTTVLACIEDALAVIKQVPSLMKTVSTVVRSLHVIKPEDEDHDVSFSEPLIPFSIFVSVPEKRIANDALRVAEAIVHEAMHLQLTLLEGTVPFVVSSSQKYYSPWKKEHRNAQGILHALYVFGVIEEFLKRLMLTKRNTSCEAGYLRDRHSVTDKQLESFRSFEHCSDLSRVGVCLVRKLMQR